MSAHSRIAFVLQRTALLALLLGGFVGTASPQVIGGNPGLVLRQAPDGIDLAGASIAFSSTGSIFVCYSRDVDFNVADVVVLRSDDSGQTWSQWGVLGDQNAGNNFNSPQMRIADGPANERVFVSYIRDSPSEGLDVAWADASAATPTWTTVVVFDTYQVGVYPEVEDYSLDVRPSATAPTVVAVGAAIATDTESVEWTYSVSIDAGTNFSAPIVVHSFTGTDDPYGYEFQGVVSLGAGDRVAMAMNWGWRRLSEPRQGELYYIEAAANGLGGWPASPTLIEVTNEDAVGLDMVAMQVGDDVVIASHRRNASDDFEPRLWASRNGGTTWQLATLPTDKTYADFRAVRTSAGPRVMAYADGGLHELRPAGLVTGAWEDLLWNASVFALAPQALDLAEDPTAPGERAVVWNAYLGGAYSTDAVRFDALWRAEPGYGVNKDDTAQNDGTANFDSAPAVGDLDGDGLKEIVLTSTGVNGSSVHAFAVSSAIAPPNSTLLQRPSSAASAPVLFDLDGDGELEVYVGSTAGGVEAFDADLNPLQQWPAVFPGKNGDTWVSAGTVSGLTYGELVAVNEDQVHLLNSIGLEKPGWPWTAPSGIGVGRAAIGDVDADGSTEVVAAFTDAVYVLDADGTVQHTFNGPFEMSAGVTLVDLDGDSDLEVVGPTTTGVLLVVHHDGTSYGAAYPFDTGTGEPMSPVSVGDLMDAASLALCFTSGTNLFAMNPGGNALPGFPVTLPREAATEPILNRIARPNTQRVQLVTGDDTGAVHLHTPLADSPRDWPHSYGTMSMLPTVADDLDADGVVDLVVVQANALLVLDMGVATLPSTFSKWKQAGKNRARTSCVNCGLGTPTAVGPGAASGSLVSFVGATPNPASGFTDFRFSLPVAAEVDLTIYDLRGRRVRGLLREPRTAGSHEVHWGGDDDRGASVAAGMYFGRLTVRDGAIRRVLVRKLEVVR